MSRFDRRTLLNALALSGAATMAPRAFAENERKTMGQRLRPHFGYEDVIKRARELHDAPYDAKPPKLPAALSKLDFDAYREIRFKPEKSPLGPSSGPFRLQLFHLGFIYTRPVVVNTIRDGIATPVPYSPSLFDFGHTKIEKNLPVNLGFAGFRLHYPLNSPHGLDEVVSFLGATYFRFLGRGQAYGLSARGLSVNTGGDDEEFPFFREFWIETSKKHPNKATIYALLDSASVTGAYQFDLYPGVESVMEVQATIFPRKDNVKFGLAPLTSMFFYGENHTKFHRDYRPELHDSDGLLMHERSGDWIWRPLRSAPIVTMSTFPQPSPLGYGLVQRDRHFDHYQDLDLNYQIRPTYFVQPHADWGDGRIELLELATKDETADNVVAYWTPTKPPPADKPFIYSYRIRALLEAPDLSPKGHAINTWWTAPKALGSSEQVSADERRYIVDFSGGDLGFYRNDPNMVKITASTDQGKILRTILVPNPHIDGFRAMIDVKFDRYQTTNMRAQLHAGKRVLTETWLMPWTAELKKP